MVGRRLSARLQTGARFATHRVQVREEIANARDINQILCNSYFSRESILRAYGVDARVCYLGINTKFFKPRGAPRGHVIGLGSFTREKGLELCVRAIARISPRRPPLVWVGNHVDPAYLGEVKKLAAELDVAFEPRVLVADDELLDLLSSANAMIYAPRLEPFGLATARSGRMRSSGCGGGGRWCSRNGSGRD